MNASGLLISCATPATMLPRPAIFSFWTISAWARLRAALVSRSAFIARSRSSFWAASRVSVSLRSVMSVCEPAIRNGLPEESLKAAPRARIQR